MKYEFKSNTEIDMYLGDSAGTTLTGFNFVNEFVDSNGDIVALEKPFVAKINIVLPSGAFDIRQLYSIIQKGYSLILTKYIQGGMNDDTLAKFPQNDKYNPNVF